MSCIWITRSRAAGCAAICLCADGIVIGRQRAGTMVRRMGIDAIYPRPNTSKPDARLRLPRCRRRLVQPAGSRLAALDHDGGRVPPRGVPERNPRQRRTTVVARPARQLPGVCLRPGRARGSRSRIHPPDGKKPACTELASLRVTTHCVAHDHGLALSRRSRHEPFARGDGLISSTEATSSSGRPSRRQSTPPTKNRMAVFRG